MHCWLAVLRRRLWLSLAGLIVLSTIPLAAQRIEDGILLPKQRVATGVIYSHDSWDHYWEGALNRTNGNLGTVTTQNATFVGIFGPMRNLNAFVMVPYVWTHASQGVLHPQSGLQDLTLAVKYQAVRLPLGDIGELHGIAAVSGSLPMTNYEPDDQPLSIGNHSRTIAPRATVNLRMWDRLYADATAAYVFRDIVKLDRPYYYTNGQFVLSNQVPMPNQFQYSVSAGYFHHDLLLVGEFIQQQTRGGGDIRRQDMPFISNRVNLSRYGARAQVPIPHLHNLQAWFAFDKTYDGRNVGESDTFTSAVMYSVPLRRFGRQ